MRRIQSIAVGLVMAFSSTVMLSTSASANPVAGGGYSSSYAGESAFTSVAPGLSGQMSAIFFNDGTQPWAPGVVGLLVCAADKLTCNVPSNTTFNQGWLSQTVYTSVATTVQPGQNGFFIYNFAVPQNTPTGTVTTFYGDVGLIATGTMLRPEGYFQSNTVPTPTENLSVAPNPASVQVGSSLQFTVSGQATGSTISWTVNGGCGAITGAGLFVATAMNSASQPCTVAATAPGGTGLAVVRVYGQPATLGCSATPTTIVANDGIAGGVSTATIAIKDSNGNTVTNASSPVINVANVTPSLATMTPSGAVTPSGGAVIVTIATTTTAGAIQLSASAAGVTGCNVIVTSTGPGNAARTIASFLLAPIAADGISKSTLQIDVTDQNGNRVITDNVTQLTITRDASSALVCQVTNILRGSGTAGAGSGIATADQGRVQFEVQSTTTPGQCLFYVTTNNTAISGSSAVMTTQIVGAANKLAVLSNDSPHAAANSGTCAPTGTNTDLSCTKIVVAVEDGNGSILTGDASRTITASLDANTCTGSGAPVTPRGSSTEAAGRATFVFSSAGGYSGCVITFSSAGLIGANTTAAWTAGGADHLACTFSPTSIPANNTATSVGQVTVRDANNNVVTGGTYGVSFSSSGGSATTLLTTGIQNTSNGYAGFTVKATNTIGTDSYTPVLNTGSLPQPSISCSISTHP